ncbi:winged helix-turn-helix domain-containing protein [Haloarculaceae archaeon H-GB2-1]|nr:winged helix-turn-helix domain-containing protein [Haloarculaceae archaeon H-GB1-1]MEA5387039.1 winged helix-turn-helix domain-containing protein [Haloarculaceae archaeon H-GB11]MEA5408541.1 winged helix-turn-helix domain-containing protein [Haloarculaceae archaeon H-GB2-1]
MGSLLPLRGEAEQSPGSPRVLDLDDEATAEALSALSSETARSILQVLYESPRTAPEIREEVGTSLQNVHYHLEKLQDADLVQPAGTGYSEKGNEMTVFAPASRAVVLFAGQEQDGSRLRQFLSRLLGAVGVLAAASLGVRAVVDRLTPSQGDYQFTSRSGGDAAAAQETAVESGASSTGANATLDTSREAIQVTTKAATQQPPVDPALAFFLGGVFMLVVVGAWWYWRQR